LPGNGRDNRGIGLLHSDEDAFIGILVRFAPLAGDALIIGDALNRDQAVIFRTGLNSFHQQGDFKILLHDTRVRSFTINII
jgi:hypothetical protein